MANKEYNLLTPAPTVGATALSRGVAVKFSAGVLVACGANERAIGFVTQDAAIGALASVALIGGGAVGIAAGTIAIGDNLKTDANGHLVATTSTSDSVVAVATEAAVDNDVFGILPLSLGATTVSSSTQELTATGAVTAAIEAVELNHATVVIAATIADATNHQGLFVVKNTSASGTAAHTLTLTSGTFDGTNNVATLNAPNEALIVYFDSAGNGTIVENVGSVALS
jgi:hypothetical protein